MKMDFGSLAPAAVRTAVAGYLPGLIIPALFALLVSATIRIHSYAPAATLAATVGCLMAVAALSLFILLARGSRLHLSPPLAGLLLALALSAVISVAGSGQVEISQHRLQLYVAVALLATATYLAYRDQPRLPLEAFCLAIALVHLPFLAAAILWIADGSPPFWQYGPQLAHFANVRQYAEFAFVAAACATALGVLSPRLVVVSLVLGGAAVFGIVLTGSRGALLSWGLFVLLLCVFGPARLRAGLIGAVVLAASASLVWYLDRSGLLESPNIFGRIATVVASEQSVLESGRITLWLLSLEQVLVHPFFGSGPEGYWISGCCERNIMQAHNFVLQFLMEFGLVGCAILLLLLLHAVRRMGGVASTCSLVRVMPANRVLVALFAAYLAYAMIDQMMYHLLPMLHFALFAGLLAAGLAHARAARVA